MRSGTLICMATRENDSLLLIEKIDNSWSCLVTWTESGVVKYQVRRFKEDIISDFMNDSFNHIFRRVIILVEAE